MKKALAILMIMAIGFAASAQRIDPKDIVSREKQNLYAKIVDLSADQKLLLDGIYDEFLQTIQEIRKEMQSGTIEREQIREKMQNLRKEKDGLIGDVLNDKQYTIYKEMISSNRKKMEERRKNRQTQ